MNYFNEYGNHIQSSSEETPTSSVVISHKHERQKKEFDDGVFKSSLDNQDHAKRLNY